MAAKNTVLKRKIGSDIFEMMPKTTAGQVVVSYGDCVDLASALTKVYTDVESWNTFKANVDFAGTDAALDTLRELIDMINKEDQAGSIANKLKSIEDKIAAINTKNGEQDQAIADLQAKDTALAGDITKANEATAKVASDLATAKEALEAKDTELKGEIDALDGRLTTAESDIDTAQADITAAQKAIATLEAGTSVVYCGTEIPSNFTDRDLFMEISE